MDPFALPGEMTGQGGKGRAAEKQDGPD